MASSFLDLPTELHDAILTYGLDLLDWGALTWTSKDARIKLSDVKMQHICMENTPYVILVDNKEII